MTTPDPRILVTSSIGFVWRNDVFTVLRKERVCSKCATYLFIHNPTGKQILGFCDKCRANAIIETKEAK